MIRDKFLYSMLHYPGVTEEMAKAMKKAGVDSPKKLKALSVAELRAFDLTLANANKTKDRAKK